MLAELAILAFFQSGAARVLVVANENSPESKEVAAYYMDKRAIPGKNLVTIKTATTDEISFADYEKQILEPVGQKLIELKNKIDYIVLTTRVPLRLDNHEGASVDSMLAVLRFPQGRKKEPVYLDNPYFKSTEHFSNDKFGIYLVTRLDGYTVADCKRLVDRGLRAKLQKGIFILDGTPTKGGGIGEMNDALTKTADSLKAKGYKVQYDTAPPSIQPEGVLMGYIGWGSNDQNWRLETWKKIEFHPGAIAETFVSTSARTFRPTTGGQSLIADLIKQGVTGVKGYVSEPFITACARPDILMDRYLNGFNLAESFYAASQVVKWKDVVIGDPMANLGK